MCTRPLIFITLSLLFASAKAQSVYTLTGARQAGLGSAVVALFDGSNFQGNIAGLAKTKQTTIMLSHEHRPSLPGADRMSAHMAAPTAWGVFSAGVFQFGDALYKEQTLSAGYSHQLGLAAIGARADYVRYQPEGFPARQTLAVALGCIAEITPQFLVGASISNINQAQLNKKTQERIPSRMTVGLAFVPSKKVYSALEVHKELLHTASVRMGIEYTPFKKIAFRTGYQLHPSQFSAGVGFITNRFRIDYAARYATVLHLMHHVSIAYEFGR
jgi:hypothetical protein